MKNPLLSVIILSFNTRNYLEQCLQAVAESKGFQAGELEVIVVDNNSDDGSDRVIAKLKVQSSTPKGGQAKFKVTAIKNKQNLGFAGGNNVGIKKAKGKYLLILNSDTTVYSDTLIKMVKFADGLPKLGAATCKVELPGGKIDPACHRGFPTPWSAFTYLFGLEKIFSRSRLFSGYHQGWKNLDEPHRVDVIAGSFFLIPRKVIENVGLLDESFFMYGEDIDWCFRIKQAGFEIWYNPEVKILHYKKQSGRAKNREQRTENSEQKIRNMADYYFVYTMEQFYRKHYVNKYPKLVNWLVLASINLLKSLTLDPSTPLRSARDDEAKRVVIDARLAGLGNAGIGRYVQSLVERLESSSRREEGPEGLEGKDGGINILSVRSGPKHYSLMEQLWFPSVLKSLRPDLAHFPHFNVPLLYNEPFVVTIHDLLWHERVGFEATTLPKWLYLIKYLGYRAVLRHAVLGSKAIIVPSRWVKNKIVERFPEVESKINVIYEGVSDIFGGVSLLKQGDSSSYDFGYLIYTGSLYPHKNLGLVLNVLKHFGDLKLVVACARSVFWEKFRQEVKNRRLEDRVVLAGFVPDEELVGLYQRAVAFVFPSLSEGFGLPGLEAMAVGCPVVSSTAGALPEIYGNAAIYFDPKNETELIDKIREIRENQGYRKKMIGLGKDRAKIFSWDKCAKDTFGVYQEVISSVVERSSEAI